ncbi:hypothetical protein [Mesorhizobium captivum]|nr:hypothetical protein [Mesorhizobium sp. VK3C]MDX8447060.1 hypothetical protein [Mesorhizobium sp. VK3C]
MSSSTALAEAKLDAYLGIDEGDDHDVGNVVKLPVSRKTQTRT